MRSGLQAASQAQRQVGKERSDLYRKLGLGLFESEIRPQAVSEWIRRVAEIDAARADVETRLNASIAETQALPQGTMSKFWGTLVGIPLIVIALVWGASSLLPLALQGPEAVIAEPASLDPQDEKDRTVLRFIQAGTRNDDQTRDDAVRILREDILTMGASADQSHLPVLAKVLSSKEPDLREAAANAMGMIGPTVNETNALAQLLTDAEAPVARAARRALEASRDPAAPQLLANAPAGK
jgi:HEAT repeat protein